MSKTAGAKKVDVDGEANDLIVDFGERRRLSSNIDCEVIKMESSVPPHPVTTTAAAITIASIETLFHFYSTRRQMHTVMLAVAKKIMSKTGAKRVDGEAYDLIVDFGERRRLSSNNDCEVIVEMESSAPPQPQPATTTKAAAITIAATTTTRAAAADKHVTFSEDIHTRSFQYPSKEELAQRWHSMEDKLLFKQEMARDVQSVRHILSTVPMEALEKEILYWCLGLEARVSSQVTRFVREQREWHARSVEEMQYRLDADQLAVYAMGQSLQSRERAENIAAGNWQILLS